MSFEKGLTYTFLDGVPGNVSTYIKLKESTDAHLFTDDDWSDARIVYYMTEPIPESAWLWDLYKNKYHYNVNKTYIHIMNLLQQIH
jgi:hypothetical protein